MVVKERALTTKEVPMIEVETLAFLIAQGRHLAALQEVGLDEELFSPGGKLVYRCIVETAQRHPDTVQSMFEVAPESLHPLLSELRQLGDLLFPQPELAPSMLFEIKKWIRETQC